MNAFKKSFILISIQHFTFNIHSKHIIIFYYIKHTNYTKKECFYESY